jgi:hypothetical protein
LIQEGEDFGRHLCQLNVFEMVLDFPLVPLSRSVPARWRNDIAAIGFDVDALLDVGLGWRTLCCWLSESAGFWLSPRFVTV